MNSNEQGQVPIELGEICRRSDLAQASTQDGWSPIREEKQRILKMRAKALAMEPVIRPAVDTVIEVVAFLLADETYGIELRFVREIHPLKTFTPLSGTPAFVLGIVNLRGQILSVVDLKKFFEIPDQGLTELNKIIVLQQGDMEFGILADAVLGVQSVPRDQIQPGLPTLSGIKENYLKGITPQRLIILNGGNILSDNSIVVNDAVS